MKRSIKILMLLCACMLMCSMLLTACSGDGTSDHTTSGNATSGSTTSGDTTSNGTTSESTASDSATSDTTTSDGTTESTQSSSTEDTKPNVHTHNFGEWTVVKEATKMEDGLKEKTCAACGVKESEVLYATGSLGLKYSESGNGYAVAGIGTCTDADIVIPSIYNGKFVTGIGDYAFQYCDSLTSVVIPNSITGIGKFAFYNCESLTSVVIPDSVTSIGEAAFSVSSAYCSNLTSVTIGNGVMSIGYDAFRYCSKLVEVINKSKFDFSQGSSNHGYIAYYALEIHSGESKIVNKDDYLFYTHNGANLLLGYCGNETKLILPEDYNGENYIIYQCAFGASDLMSVTIGNGITGIGERAFAACGKLVEVINKSNLKISKGSSDHGYIAYYALEVHNEESKIINKHDYLFYTYGGVNYLLGYSGNETELVLPENYNGEAYQICQYAFCKYSDLTSIVIPDNVTSIGTRAFYECRNLTSVTIGSGVTSIGVGAFRTFSYLTSIQYTGTTSQWKAISKDTDWKHDRIRNVICSDGEVYI